MAGELTRRHRNTILNVESGRPVKFKTIAELMVRMGYPANSPEMGGIALLWLESVTGIPLSQPDVEAAARKVIATYGTSARTAARRLHEAIHRSSLTPEQIDLLVYAASQPNVLNIVNLVRIQVKGQAGIDPTEHLKVAEDK